LEGMSGHDNGAPPVIRAVSLADAPSIRELFDQLGYPLAPESVAERLKLIEEAPHTRIFVAAETSGAISGLIHVGMLVSIEHGRAGQVLALVVDSRRRGSGVGSLLLDFAEQWARERGAGAVVLNSRVEREAARAFYGARGYVIQKQQFRFRKSLKG
jgi:GNAT superfamily N-acetyltransferase